MEFREDIGQYVFEYEGLIFAWDEEPEEDIQDTVKTLSWLAGYRRLGYHACNETHRCNQ